VAWAELSQGGGRGVAADPVAPYNDELSGHSQNSSGSAAAHDSGQQCDPWQDTGSISPGTTSYTPALAQPQWAPAASDLATLNAQPEREARLDEYDALISPLAIPVKGHVVAAGQHRPECIASQPLSGTTTTDLSLSVALG
jgi:hypothetical protein